MTALARRYSKNRDAQRPPGSTIKMMTAIIAHDWIDLSELDDVVTIVSSDVVNWATNSNMQLEVNDVLSYRDLIYGLMLPSGNDAALALSRLIGGRILVSEGGSSANATDNRNRFIAEMNTLAVTYEMSETTFTDAVGIAFGNRSTADDLARLMLNYAERDLLVTIAGTLDRTITITGVNARTYNVEHTIDPAGTVPFPEFVCGKTGTVTWPSNPEESSGGCCAMLWESPNGIRRVSVVMGAEPPAERFVDLRRMIDSELARLGEL